MGTPELGLIGDIGATYSRFALVTSDGPVSPARVYATNEHRSLFDHRDLFERRATKKSTKEGPTCGRCTHLRRFRFTHQSSVDILDSRFAGPNSVSGFM